jgi:hypothetical protein
MGVHVNRNKGHAVLIRVPESDYRLLRRISRYPTAWVRAVVQRALERVRPRNRKG